MKLDPSIKEEVVELLNRLFKIEQEIANLWKFHPDNPDAIDIVSEFGRLQREATSIEAYFQEKGIEFKEEEG
jgi:ABC-type iron transport system FetAB ATPase subunit